MTQALATIDAETGELLEVGPTANLFGTANPTEVVLRAKDAADALADVIKRRELYKVIGQKAHVYVEAWTLLGSMLGVFPVEDGHAEPVEIDGIAGFRATVKAVTKDGDVVGRATAYCMRDESKWKEKPLHQLAGMAQTRATGRALRMPLGFIVQLAGYDTTPLEEEFEPSDRPKREVVNKTSTRKATQKDFQRLYAVIEELKKEHPDTDWEGLSKQLALEMFRADSRSQLTKTELDDLIKALPTADVKF